MGRLPAQWAGRTITARWPYTMAAELTLTTGQKNKQYPDSSFQNGVDKPFEIHRMIPRVYALDDNGILLTTQPDQGLLQGLVRAMMTDLGRTQQMVKTPTLLDVLTKGSSERTWEFADPMYIVRSEQIQVSLDALTFPAIANLSTLSVAINFEGYLCIVAPASENR
jgi:hypothetical protein